MKFNLANQTEAYQAFEHLTNLNGQKVIVSITKVLPKRSLNQNNFLHLLLSAFGANFGWTLAESKILYKREINPDLYIYEKNGTKFLKSSADLNTADMTKSIDRLREYSAEQGYPLPTAEDAGWLMAIENRVEESSGYL